jgi:peptidoglycan hydrolase CwlO-like protein
LTEEIQQHQAQIEEAKKQITEMGAKVEKTKNDFQITYASLTSQIQADIDNMKKYLK